MGPNSERTEEIVEVNDDARVFRTNGYISARLNNGRGTFFMPNHNFGGPDKGDILEVVMRTGKIARAVVIDWTQDHVSREGKIVGLCYAEDWSQYLNEFVVRE